MKWFLVLVLAFGLPSALSAETITFDNQSRHRVKLAAPGGSAALEAASGPVEVTFDSDREIGLEVNIWWISNPRQLCQIFTPWRRLVVISGTDTIKCRSLAN